MSTPTRFIRHIDNYEQAARFYCRVHALDPDELESFPHPDGKPMHMRRPRWINVAWQLRDLDTMNTALSVYKPEYEQ